VLTLADLRDYKVEVRAPVVADTMGFTVISMPPPSSGGASLILVSLSLMAPCFPFACIA
jgi:gamma-glutamyltranspeptidase/glutathione hydrolase/leukotriene-C4 hydrolase